MNSLWTILLQLKKDIRIAFVVDGYMPVFLVDGESLPLHSKLCHVVCGSYCRQHASFPAIIPEQKSGSSAAQIRILRSEQID